MVCEGRGFATSVKRQNPAIQITHCCLHGQAQPIVKLSFGGKNTFHVERFLLLLYV